MTRWLEISVTVPRELVDAVALIFHEMGTGGVVIEDPAFIIGRPGATDGGAPHSSPGVAVKGYLPCDSSAAGCLEDLSRRMGDYGLDWQSKMVREEEWAGAWRAYYKPVRVGRRLVVKPAWEEYEVRAGEIVIELDPGTAFGCGNHPTTAMCLALLEERVRGGETVCDVGTGSGILAVAAVLLGAARVLALDVDEQAVHTARKNAELNGVAGRVTVQRGDLLNGVEVEADLVVANIVADAIIRLAPEAAAALKPGGCLIASGIITERAAEVCGTLRDAGLVSEEQKEDSGWVAVVCRKPAAG